ncbi:MAG: hypothetical protein IJP96_06945 [Synergistaceae bacterium]|nr:hypothetical protein [Synergistaceae bacterium]
MTIDPLCLYCKHREDDFKCKAYPKGIPDALLYGTHFYPKPGDHGIQFEVKEEAASFYPAWYKDSQEEEDRRYREYKPDDDIM